MLSDDEALADDIVGYRAKKSKIFTREEVDEFVRTAPNQVFLTITVSINRQNKI